MHEPVRTACLGSESLLKRRIEVLTGRAGFLPEVDRVQDLDLLFLGVAKAERFKAAASALRGGTHVCLEWPPTASTQECARLVRLSEEAGREAAVSRPLRIGLRDLPDEWRARIVSMELTGSVPVTAALADVVDLSFALVGSGSVRRVEAEAAYDEKRTLTSAAVSIRFHSGAFAQATIRSGGRPGPVTVYAAGSGHELERELLVDDAAVRRETLDVIEAVGEGRAVPVSALDALQTLRVIERVMSVLR